MNARTLIWEAWPSKPAVSLQYELNLRGRAVSYRQARRIAESGRVPRSLWGDVLDVLDHRMAQRREQVAEADRQIKLARSQIRSVLAETRVARVERKALPQDSLPGLKHHIGARGK